MAPFLQRESSYTKEITAVRTMVPLLFIDSIKNQDEKVVLFEGSNRRDLNDLKSEKVTSAAKYDAV